MAQRNENFSKLAANYLFVEIANRKKKFLAENPTANLISLGIGDTTQPLPPFIISGMSKKLMELSNEETYTGYPEYNGSLELRKLVATVIYKNLVSEDEIFISDGSKPDLARLQFLFSTETKFAVQDPVYPAYVDGLVISGRGGEWLENEKRYSNIYYMDCLPENNFFPQLNKIHSDVSCIYFCSPNNPTGVAATREQLYELVQFALNNKKIIIFDSAYRDYITDDSIPRSIYEIEGAKYVSFEVSSLSKTAGFTGVRLGWTVCPRELKFSNMSSVIDDWARIVGTFFNGPSNVAEAGAMAVMRIEGQVQVKSLINYYLENATLLRSVFSKLQQHFAVYGGLHSPYIWIKILEPNKTSWQVFQELLENIQIVTTPGVGFGKNGEGFLRISAFANKKDVENAAKRICNYFNQTNI